MCMEKEECEVCFSDLQKKGNELFDNMEKKHDSFMSKMETRHNILMGVQLFLLGLFAVAIIGIWSETAKKANKNEVLRIDDAQTIRELGDKYYDARYVIKNSAEPDPINYKQFVETLFQRASRGENIHN